MGNQATASDRRAHQRYGCAGDAEIVLPGRGLRFQGKIRDLSVGGCFLEMACPLERGTSVEIWMCAQGMPLRMAANLMVTRGSGVGFRFYGVTARKLDLIRSLIADLAEERAAHENAQAPAAVGDAANPAPAGASEPQLPPPRDDPAGHQPPPRTWLRRLLARMADRLPIWRRP